MIYKDFQGLKLSMLGFGTMRLPQKEDGSIDEELAARMTDCALRHGVNYFDTAYPYHGGKSELVMGKILSGYPRDRFYLADKYPGHQISSSYDPAAVFEEQLEKCGTPYFDFYLLHNVYENSIGVYEEPKWGIIDYFKEQKRNGRIRHLGFSSHARPETLRAFLERHGEDMEFCQIQLNYLDWTLQDARQKCEILSEFGIPVWVMEPVRGGRLIKLSEQEYAPLQAAAPGRDAAEWAFRFLQDIPGVTVVLSGMSDMAQMEENIALFERENPLREEEKEMLLRTADLMKNALPCTACRYCCDGCPMGLDIPVLIHGYNDLRFGGGTTVSMQMDALSADKLPSACIGCGACAAICPQNIDIPSAMREFSELLEKAPKWAEICREREEAARKIREAAKASGK